MTRKFDLYARIDLDVGKILAGSLQIVDLGPAYLAEVTPRTLPTLARDQEQSANTLAT